MNLTAELILYIIDNFLNEKDKHTFATSNKKLWVIAILPRAKPFTLMRKINSLEIHRLTHLILRNTFYEPELIRHVLTYAVNLQVITFEERGKFSLKFIQMFMTIEKKCKFLVPLKAYDAFMLVVEDSENKCITINLNLPSSLKEMKTPEEVERKVQFFKSIEKAKYVADIKNTIIMKNQLSHLVPCHVNRLFNTKEYVVYDNSHVKVKVTSEQQAESIVSFCSKFMEAVVILENYWFFLTSFSVFVHDKNVDDCADNSLVGHQQEAVSFIRKKTRAGCDYFELTTRFNNVELLTTSGFFGNIDSNTVLAFVGSSIQNLPSSLAQRYDTVSSKYVFVPRTSVPLTKVERLLNQYIKQHAANKWMLISKKYEEKGFVPNHPLSFMTKTNAQKAASLLLKVFVKKTLYQNEIKEVMSNLQKIPDKSSTASEKLIKRYIMDLSSMDEFLDRTYNLTEVKRDMLFVYEHTLAGALKRNNIAVAKRAENEYKPVTINLFNEDT